MSIAIWDTSNSSSFDNDVPVSANITDAEIMFRRASILRVFCYYTGDPLAPDFSRVDSGRKLKALLMLSSSPYKTIKHSHSQYPLRQAGDSGKSAVNVAPPAISGAYIKRFAVDANAWLGYLTR